MANAEWRRQAELKKIEQLERKLEAEDLLREEEVRLISASQQIRNVRAKLEETRAELGIFEQKQLLVRNIEITEADEADLAREFSRSIYRVLDGLRTTTAELDNGTAADDEDARGGGREEHEGEEAADGGYGGYDDYDAYGYYLGKNKAAPGSGSPAASERGWEGGAAAKKPSVVEWVRVQWAHAEVTVRINDVYTFADLRDDVCRYLRLPCDEASLAELEIATPGARVGWPDNGVVMAEILKGAMPSGEEGESPVVLMRQVPPSVQLAQIVEQDQEEERELRHDVSQKAAMAHRTAHYLRTIVLARKRSRHARSLIIRGAFHLAFTVLFAISISFGTTRGFESVDAVRTALAKQRFSSQPGWMASLSCAQIEEGSAVSTPAAVGLPADTPHLGLILDEVRTPEGVHAWLRGALVDALAPRCSYDGRPVSYAPNASGGIGFYHNMITPLRLQQTRFAKSPGCDATLSVQNYPNLASRPGAENRDYPACGSVYTRSAEPFGDQATAGFTYTAAAAYTGVGGASPPYRYSGTWGSYGPDGYVRDVWAAAEYRSTIDSLLASGWIDGWTESIAAHVQLVNAQTGCLIIAMVLFEFSPAGGVMPSLSVQDMCEPDGAPKISADFSRLFAFDYYSWFELLMYALCGVYVLRVCFVQYKAWKRMTSDSEGRVLYHFTGMAYLQDTVLGIMLVAYLVGVVSLWERQDAFCELLWSMRYTMMPEGLRARMQQVIDSLVEGATAATYSQAELEVALSSLKHAFYLSVPWDGTPWGFPVFDMHWATPTFVSFLPNANTAINIRGLRAVILLMVLLKAMRYAQAWRPLASRYAGIAQNLPYITRFFLLLLHFHLCFSLQAHLVFGQDLVAFQSVVSSFMQLLFLLTGKITVANELIALDTKSGSFVGQLFLLLFMIVLVLSGSSLIISVLAEGWSNATEVLRRRRETKQRLRSLHRFSRQAEELELLTQSTADLSDTDLIALADEAEMVAGEAIEAAQKVGRLKLIRKRLASTAFSLARNSRMTKARKQDLDSEHEQIEVAEERITNRIFEVDAKFNKLASKLAAFGKAQGSAVDAALKGGAKLTREGRRTLSKAMDAGGIALASAGLAATSSTRDGAGAPAPAEATQATQAGVHESPTQETTSRMSSTAAAAFAQASAVATMAAAAPSVMFAEVSETFRTDEVGDFDAYGRVPKVETTEELARLSSVDADFHQKEAEHERAYEDRPLRRDEYDI
jgi:hypothetical protein